MCSACRTHWQWSQRNWILAHVENTVRLLAKRSPEIKILLLQLLKLELIFKFTHELSLLHCLWNNWNSIFMESLSIHVFKLVWHRHTRIFYLLSDHPVSCRLLVSGLVYWNGIYTHKECCLLKLADEHTHCCSVLPSPKLFFDNLVCFFNLLFKAAQLQMLHCS